MAVSPSVLFARLLARSRLKHLQLLVRIGELESLQKAADDVGMSQPGATHALAELESILGIALFERHSRGMRPSAYGKALLPMVRNVLGQLQTCAQTIVAMQAGVAGRVRVATIGAGQSGLLARALPPFSAAYPDAVVEVQLVGAEAMFELLEQKRADVLVCREPSQLHTDYRFIPLLSDRYVVVCSPTHRLAERTATIDDLAAEVWLVPPPTGIAARDFDLLCTTFGFVPRACWVGAKSVLRMMAMLQQRDLLAFVPYNAARQLLDSGLLVEVKSLARAPLDLPPVGLVAPHESNATTDVVRAFINQMCLWGDLPDLAAQEEGKPVPTRRHPRRTAGAGAAARRRP